MIGTERVSGAEVQRTEGTSEWRRYGKGAHRKVAGVHVLRLGGSFREMGEQHGALLAKEIPDGPIPYYRAHFEKMVGKSALGALSPLVWPALQTLLGRRVERGMPAFARETAEGIAKGAGMSARLFMDGCTMPDSLLWLAARAMDIKGPGPAVAHRLSLGLGCTSAIAWGDATKDGKLLHARNFDYHGVGNWPRSQAVIFHAPDEGQRYVSIAAAGVPLGGITAMNESGLSLTVHQHMFTDRTRLGGKPIGPVGDLVMREARSLDDAERILSSHTPIGCWTYVITDGKRREALLWEESPDRHVAHRYGSGGTDALGYANVYLDPELGATEQDLYGAYWRHNEARHRRANQLVRERRGSLDPTGMAEILADRGAGECRVSESIAMVMTVASVVFRPEDGVVWIGTGEAPTSVGTFVPFELARADHAPEHGELSTVSTEPASSREAFEHYRRAYVAYLDDRDVPRARREMEEALEKDERQSLYALLVGLTALSDLDARGAIRALDRAIELGHAHEARRASFHLWRARAHDLMGDRERAKQDYRTVLGLKADAPVRAAAMRGLRRAYTERAAERVTVDFAMADIVAP